MPPLRYYATFKVRKFESLFYKINTYLQKNTTCTGLRAEQIFSVNINYTYFSILGVAFAVPFLCYFQKLQLVVKKIWTNFCCIVLLYCTLNPNAPEKFNWKRQFPKMSKTKFSESGQRMHLKATLKLKLKLKLD